jgi:hypothetical protein
LKLSFGSGQVEGATGLMKKHRPTGCTDDPGNGHTPTVCGKLIAPLATFHQINSAAAVKLRTSLA